jgi:ATP-dependent Clp protease protease subunit
MRSLLSRLLAEASEQPFERIEQDVERDFIVSPTQAVEYGLVDQVLESRSQVMAEEKIVTAGG